MIRFIFISKSLQSFVNCSARETLWPKCLQLFETFIVFLNPSDMKLWTQIRKRFSYTKAAQRNNKLDVLTTRTTADIHRIINYL